MVCCTSTLFTKVSLRLSFHDLCTQAHFISDESLPILEDYFIAKDYYLPTSLILERLLYESHNVSCIEQCQMMCLFEDFDCQFYITTKDDNVDQGLKCFFGGFQHKSYKKLSPPNITNDNLLLNVRRDKYVNTTNGILAAHNIDNFFGWCPGDGIHLVNKLGWKLNFILKYEKYSSCTFYIVKPIGGTLKMTIPHFQVNTKYLPETLFLIQTIS